MMPFEEAKKTWERILKFEELLAYIKLGERPNLIGWLFTKDQIDKIAEAINNTRIKNEDWYVNEVRSRLKKFEPEKEKQKMKTDTMNDVLFEKLIENLRNSMTVNVIGCHFTEKQAVRIREELDSKVKMIDDFYWNQIRSRIFTEPEEPPVVKPLCKIKASMIQFDISLLEKITERDHAFFNYFDKEKDKWGTLFFKKDKDDNEWYLIIE